MKNLWPVLSFDKGVDTYETLHMWSQIIGKIKLASLPWLNHSWHITLHVSPRGFTTMSMPYKDRHFQIDFDFIDHLLKISTSQGENRSFGLINISVSDFYQKIKEILADLKIDIKIKPVPVEVEDPIPFEQDHTHSSYDKEQVKSLHMALLCMQDTFMDFRCSFKGKCSPVHFFWGSFDLAVSRFSGRRAPKHPGGIPNLPDWVAEEAYSHEVMSCGFWPGSRAFPEAVFYCYHYPEPEGFKNAIVHPEEAYYHETLREFVLPYKAVQNAPEPRKVLLEFLESTYEAGVVLASWDRAELEQ